MKLIVRLQYGSLSAKIEVLKNIKYVDMMILILKYDAIPQQCPLNNTSRVPKDQAFPGVRRQPSSHAIHKTQPEINHSELMTADAFCHARVFP